MEIGVILLSVVCVSLSVAVIGLMFRVAKLERNEEAQDGTNTMIVKHLSKLLVDVDMLVKKHNYVGKK